MLEVERDAALAGVEEGEERARLGALAACFQRRQPPSPVADARSLDLGDAGAIAGQDAGGVRPGDAAREVQHPDGPETRCRAAAHFSATAFAGEATPPGRYSGTAAKSASYRPSRRESAASSSKVNSSPIAMPSSGRMR